MLKNINEELDQGKEEGWKKMLLLFGLVLYIFEGDYYVL
jgi:hypothetical protein